MSQVTAVKMNDAFFANMGEVVKGVHKCNGFLPRKLRGLYEPLLNFENSIYALSESKSNDYDGGSWKFVQCKENDAFFMYPADDKEYTITNQNYQCEYIVDNKLFGMMMCMIAFSNLSFKHQNKESISQMYAHHYHNLRNSFYSAVDNMCEGDNRASDEVIEEIKAMSRIVYSYLD